MPYDFSMLLEFRCKNYRSFREDQRFSLTAANGRGGTEDLPLIKTGVSGIRGLRCAAIYGANASGKSNLLRAMGRFSVMISASQKRWDLADKIPGWDPFMLDEESRLGCTEFEAEVLIGKDRYRYGFSFNETTIVKEWLYEYVPTRRTLFLRQTDGTNVEVDFVGRNLTGNTLDVISKVTRPNSLFLSAAAQNNHERLKEIQAWLAKGFNILSAPDAIGMIDFSSGQCESEKTKTAFRKLLAFADIGIEDFEVIEEEAPENVKKFHRAMMRALEETDPSTAGRMRESSTYIRKDVRMLHRGAGEKLYPLDHSHQSRGTLSFFGMLGPMLNELKGDAVLLIDELASMHPHLVNALVQIFNSPKLNPRGVQVVFTTHDTGLLSSDLLRRDQIWFAEKDEEGASKIFPLTDFRPRKDLNLEVGYLNGRFGAIPVLDSDLLYSALAQEDAENTGSPCDEVG